MEQCTPKPAAPGVSLTILPGSNPPRKASRMGPRRALVLTGIWVFMALHVVQWLIMGSTLAPIEPSEGMQAVKEGVVNMGALFFVAALASTAILGRWFCGWGCHIVALQDGAAWLLKKAGVRPKPFRSRLLLWVPLLLGLYMFVWPLFYRLAVAPWLGETTGAMEMSVQLTTTNFWATFPGVLMAIPFLLVCGGLAVYLLGSKGYCTYACPYGGFFAPLDELAPMRIVVDHDKCHHCGHCTAACTSNVRVHEEVRDYGMVVDPGCMKCMDCVSVCPNNALSFGLAKPSFRVSKQGTAAAESAARRFDMTWPEEIAMAAVGIAAFLAVRGEYVALPLLFSSGFAMCVVFVVWKSWHAIHDRNAAFHQWQLRFHGAWRAAGAAWVAAGALALACVAYLLAMNGVMKLAERAESGVVAPLNVLFSDQRMEPSAEVLANAGTAMRLYTIASSFPEGWGLLPTAQGLVDRRLGYLMIVKGDFPGAEKRYRAIWEREPHSEQVAGLLGRVIAAQANRAPDAVRWYEEALERHPDWLDLRQDYIFWLQFQGDMERVIETSRKSYMAQPTNLRAMRQYSLALMEHSADAKAVQEGVDLTQKTIAIEPNNAHAYAALGRGLLRLDRREEAVKAFERAVQLDPTSQLYQGMLDEAKGSGENPMHPVEPR